MKFLNIVMFVLLFGYTAQAKPNFLVILTDDLTYRAIGYNNPAVKTPNLDWLAGEGLVFNRAYVASPICAASRAAMMSGVFPQQNGVVGLKHRGFKKYHQGGEREDQILPRQLQKAGYHCAFWGKSHVGNPLKYGFDEGKITRSPKDFQAFTKAEAFLERAAKDSQPFFLWLAPRQPHIPLRPGQKWLDMYDENSLQLDLNFRESPLDLSINDQGTPRKKLYRGGDYTNNWRNVPVGPPRSKDTVRLFIKAYYATISHLDDQVGHLIGRLEQLGLADNTVVIFLADNGFHLGNHGLGNKITMHEESVRVPMFAVGPGIVAGQRTDALVSSLDVYPTLLDLAGAERPGHLQGESLVPVLKNPEEKVREVVFSDCVGVGGKAGEGHRMARSDRWKYVLTMHDEEFLFDESKDSFELNNLAASPEHQNILKELRSRLAEWMKSNGDRKFPYE